MALSTANPPSLRVAFEGCGHGRLDDIYASVGRTAAQRGWNGVDLVIIGGDFQAVRNSNDLACMSVPQKYKQIGDFHEYYSGKKTAPYLTIFIGGNHEASNYLFELYYGGWVAPNIYYLGAANVIRCGPLRIAGLSGIWKGYDYRKPHFERLPYNNGDLQSIHHVRELDVRKLLQVRTQVDVGLSHDWPKQIELSGDYETLFRIKRGFREDSHNGRLGSTAAKYVLDRLRPAFWFSAHLHVKFAAVVQHGDYFRSGSPRPVRQISASQGGPSKASSPSKLFGMDGAIVAPVAGEEEKHPVDRPQVPHDLPKGSVLTTDVRKENEQSGKSSSGTAIAQTTSTQHELKRAPGDHQSRVSAWNNFHAMATKREAAENARRLAEPKGDTAPEADYSVKWRQVSVNDVSVDASQRKLTTVEKPTEEEPEQTVQQKSPMEKPTEGKPGQTVQQKSPMKRASGDNQSQISAWNNFHAVATKREAAENARRLAEAAEPKGKATPEADYSETWHQVSNVTVGNEPQRKVTTVEKPTEDRRDQAVQQKSPMEKPTEVRPDQSIQKSPIECVRGDNKSRVSAWNNFHALATKNEAAENARRLAQLKDGSDATPEADYSVTWRQVSVNDVSEDESQRKLTTVDKPADGNDEDPKKQKTDHQLMSSKNSDEISLELDSDSDRDRSVSTEKSKKSDATPGSQAIPAGPVSASVTVSENQPKPASQTDLRSQLPASFARPQLTATTDPSVMHPLPEAITNQTTRFLALDKCMPKRHFVELLELPAASVQGNAQYPRPFRLEYDKEWLAITRVFANELQLGDRTARSAPDRGLAFYKPLIEEAEKWVEENVVKTGKLTIPENFTPTAPFYNPAVPISTNVMPPEYSNPQTAQFCALVGIENKFHLTEEHQASAKAGPRPSDPGSDNGNTNRHPRHGGNTSGSRSSSATTVTTATTGTSSTTATTSATGAGTRACSTGTTSSTGATGTARASNAGFTGTAGAATARSTSTSPRAGIAGPTGTISRPVAAGTGSRPSSAGTTSRPSSAGTTSNARAGSAGNGSRPSSSVVTSTARGGSAGFTGTARAGNAGTTRTGPRPSAAGTTSTARAGNAGTCGNNAGQWPIRGADCVYIPSGYSPSW